MSIQSTSSGAASSTPSSSVVGAQSDTLIGDDATLNQQDTIGFISAGPVEQAAFSRPNNIDDLLAALKAPEDLDHSIASYLSRPVKIESVQFSSQSNRGEYINTTTLGNRIGYDPSLALRTGAQFALHRQKLAGFYGMTATAVLKVVVNAQPFEAGAFMIGFAPGMNEGATECMNPLMKNNTSIVDGSFRIPFASGLPHKIVNVSQHSEAELCIPYIAPQPFLNLLNPDDWGEFFILSLSPLVSGVNNAYCEVTTYLSFKDVKLFGAARDFTAQSSNQPLMTFPKVTEMSERQTSGKGQISNLAGTIAGIPLLSAVAPEVTLAAKGVQQISEMFGMSKPNVEAQFSRMSITPFGQPQNVDGTSNAFKLGVSEGQMTEILPMGYTDADEMTINELVREPNYLTHFVITTTQNPGAQLAWFPAAPNCTLATLNAQGQFADFFPTRLCYVAQMFRFWRGSIRLTFHVIATKFHSCRLRFVYDLETVVGPSENTIPYRYSKIIDIRDSTSFTLELPYMHTQPWRTVPNTCVPSVTPSWFVSPVDSLQSTYRDNTLYVYLENNLRAPDTVASAIDVLVYASAGTDFEVSAPQQSFISYYSGSVDDQAREMKPQTATDSVSKSDTIPVMNMCSDQQIDLSASIRASTVTQGEEVQSLRQLIKRYSLVGNGNIAHNTSVMILPFMDPYSGSASNRWAKDWLRRTMILYRFWRGGRRFLITINPPTAQQGQINVTYSPATYLWDQSINTPFNYGYQCPVQYLQHTGGGATFKTTDAINVPEGVSFPISLPLQGGIELQFPFYSRFPYLWQQLHLRSAPMINYITGITLETLPAGVAILGYSNPGATASPMSIYMAAADDTTGALKLGAPICRYNVTYNLAGNL